MAEKQTNHPSDREPSNGFIARSAKKVGSALLAGVEPQAEAMAERMRKKAIEESPAGRGTADEFMADHADEAARIVAERKAAEAEAAATHIPVQDQSPDAEVIRVNFQTGERQ